MTAPQLPPRRVPVAHPIGSERRYEPGHFLVRVTRGGPLVPAFLEYIDHEPFEPENKLDRGHLSTFPFVAIAGEVRPPEELTERFGWPPTHWKYAEPISAEEYAFRLKRLRWAERNAPGRPELAPKKRIDPAQLELPSFARENSI